MSQFAPPDALQYSILIIGYRSLRFLKPCMDSLLKMEGPSHEILFLDNRSPEPEANWMEENFHDSKIRIFRSEENLFFAGGVNYLAARAQGEFLVLLNPDTLVEPDWLKLLDAYLRKTGYEGANSEIRQWEHPNLKADTRWCLDPFGLIHFLDPTPQNPDLIFSASGSGMAVKRSVFAGIGAMDTDYKMYFEEIDLCWRMNLMGYRIGSAPGAVIHHVGHGSSSKTFFLWNRFRGRRNRIWSFLKNAGPWLLLIFIPSHLIICLASIGLNILNGQFKNAVAEVAAVADAIFHAGIPLLKRKAIQKNRKVSDSEFVARGFIVFRIKGLDGLFKRKAIKLG